jgi:RNA polymerase sigma factor (sigma-70 family)
MVETRLQGKSGSRSGVAAKPALDPTDPRLSELLGRLRGRFQVILRRYQVPERDAEDVLQETLLLFILKRPTIRCPEAWLVTTLRNQALMYQRRRRSRRRFVLEPGHDLRPAADALAEPATGRLEARLMLERGLRRLRFEEREALRLRHVEGRSPAEVASRLGYRPDTIRKLLSRAFRTVRRALRRHLPRV